MPQKWLQVKGDPSVRAFLFQIGMTFSCDGAHYIDHKEFFDRLETFAATGCYDTLPAVASV